MITINENVRLTKNQHQVLKIACEVYQKSFSEYIQEALVQTMRSDIDDGNLAISLLERLDDGPGEGETEKSVKDDNKSAGEIIDSMSVLDELTRLNKLSGPRPSK
jgi:predicted DNA-binding protein